MIRNNFHFLFVELEKIKIQTWLKHIKLSSNKLQNVFKLFCMRSDDMCVLPGVLLYSFIIRFTVVSKIFATAFKIIDMNTYVIGFIVPAVIFLFRPIQTAKHVRQKLKIN